MVFLPFSLVCRPLQKLYKEKYNAEKGQSSYTTMETLPEVSHAMEVNKQQSEVITHNAFPLIQTVLCL